MKKRAGLGCLFIDRLIVCSELPCGLLRLQNEDVTIGPSVGGYTHCHKKYTLPPQLGTVIWRPE